MINSPQINTSEYFEGTPKKGVSLGYIIDIKNTLNPKQDKMMLDNFSSKRIVIHNQNTTGGEQKAFLPW